MKLENEFTVPASIDEAWALLLDVPRVATCLPGATVEEGGGDEGVYQGAMKIKIGPITAQYKGTVEIQEADEANRKVAMRAQAKDARGQGTAAATITSTMSEVQDGTRVKVETDMRVTGPAAQFGRGVMQDVSAKLMKRFAECLAEQLSGKDDETAAPAEAEPRAAVAEAAPEPSEEVPSASSGISTAEQAEEPAAPSASSGESTAERAEPAAPSASSGESTAKPTPAPKPKAADDVLDLGEASRDAVLKRAIPVVAGVVGLLILLRILRR